MVFDIFIFGHMAEFNFFRIQKITKSNYFRLEAYNNFQLRFRIIAKLTFSKPTTVVLPVVFKKLPSRINIAGGCNLKYVLSSDFGKFSKSFTKSPFLALLMRSSSKHTFGLRYALGFANSCSTVGRRESAFVQLGSLMKLSGQKGAGKTPIGRPHGVLKSRFYPISPQRFSLVVPVHA